MIIEHLAHRDTWHEYAAFFPMDYTRTRRMVRMVTARAMRYAGLTFAEIGERMKISPAMAAHLVRQAARDITVAHAARLPRGSDEILRGLRQGGYGAAVEGVSARVRAVSSDKHGAGGRRAAARASRIRVPAAMTASDVAVVAVCCGLLGVTPLAVMLLVLFL